MKTMGLTRLYLVNPLKFPHDEATALAAHADDVLAQARVCTTLDEALDGTVFTVASTARARGLTHRVLSAREVGSRMAGEAAHGEVALVMGTEKWGLSTEEVSRCNVIGYIPCNPEFSSLNLAAAVQVFSYEILQGVTAGAFEPAPDKDPRASHGEVERLVEHLEQVLYQVDFLNERHPKKVMLRLRRLLARAQPEKKEVRILRGVLTEMQRNMVPTALERGRSVWGHRAQADPLGDEDKLD